MTKIIQTEKQMFCSVCMKFMCNIHGYEESRPDYKSYRSFFFRDFIISFRNLLINGLYLSTIKNNNISLHKVILTKLEEFNLSMSKRKYIKLFSTLKKIEYSADNTELFKNIENKITYKICMNNCYMANSFSINNQFCRDFDIIVEKYLMYINSNYGSINLFSDSILSKNVFVLLEYIIKLVEIFKFNPCKIKKYLMFVSKGFGKFSMQSNETLAYSLYNKDENEININLSDDSLLCSTNNKEKKSDCNFNNNILNLCINNVSCLQVT